MFLGERMKLNLPACLLENNKVLNIAYIFFLLFFNAKDKKLLKT